MAIGSLGGSANQILIHIIGDDKDFQGALKQSDASMGSFASNMKSYVPLIGAAFAGMAAAAVTYSVKIAMVHEQLDRGFKSMAISQGKNADEYLRKLKEVSHGTVSEVEIMRKANQAMLLGIDLETITHMMEGAAIIAQATGQDVGYMFESLALGVGRQSRMLLDNLGIIIKVEEANEVYATSLGKTVSELTDAEKKTAFLNAAMDGLNERTEALGGYTEDATTQMAKLKTNIDDAAVAAGANLTPALESVVGGLNIIIEKSNESGTAWKNLAEIMTAPLAVSELLGKQIARIQTINKLKAQGIDTEEEVVSLLRLQSDQLNDMSDAEFNRKIYLMEGFGFAEKAAKLELARVFGLRNILQIEEAITNEAEKQLTIEEKKAAYLAKYGQSVGMRAVSAGINLSRLSSTSEAYAAGDPYTRKAGAWTITGGNNSGV